MGAAALPEGCGVGAESLGRDPEDPSLPKVRSSQEAGQEGAPQPHPALSTWGPSARVESPSRGQAVSYSCLVHIQKTILI